MCVIYPNSMIYLPVQFYSLSPVLWGVILSFNIKCLIMPHSTLSFFFENVTFILNGWFLTQITLPALSCMEFLCLYSSSPSSIYSTTVLKRFRFHLRSSKSCMQNCEKQTPKELRFAKLFMQKTKTEAIPHEICISYFGSLFPEKVN